MCESRERNTLKRGYRWGRKQYQTTLTLTHHWGPPCGVFVLLFALLWVGKRPTRTTRTRNSNTQRASRGFVSSIINSASCSPQWSHRTDAIKTNTPKYVQHCTKSALSSALQHCPPLHASARSCSDESSRPKCAASQANASDAPQDHECQHRCTPGLSPHVDEP